MPTGWDVCVLSFRPIYTCSHKLLVYLCSLVERHSSPFYILFALGTNSQRTIRKTWKGLWHKLKVSWHTVVCSMRRKRVGFLFDISQVPAKLCIFVVKSVYTVSFIGLGWACKISLKKWIYSSILKLNFGALSPRAIDLNFCEPWCEDCVDWSLTNVLLLQDTRQCLWNENKFSLLVKLLSLLVC